MLDLVLGMPHLMPVMLLPEMPGPPVYPRLPVNAVTDMYIMMYMMIDVMVIGYIVGVVVIIDMKRRTPGEITRIKIVPVKIYRHFPRTEINSVTGIIINLTTLQNTPSRR